MKHDEETLARTSTVKSPQDCESEDAYAAQFAGGMFPAAREYYRRRRRAYVLTKLLLEHPEIDVYKGILR